MRKFDYPRVYRALRGSIPCEKASQKYEIKFFRMSFRSETAQIDSSNVCQVYLNLANYRVQVRINEQRETIVRGKTSEKCEIQFFPSRLRSRENEICICLVQKWFSASAPLIFQFISLENATSYENVSLYIFYLLSHLQ